MKTAVLIVLTLVNAVYLLLGLLVLLPGMKEGLSTSEIPFYGAVLAGALLLGALWRHVSKGRPYWMTMGLALLALPAILHGGTLLLLAKSLWDGHRFAEEAVIVDYSEEPIQWDGFDGPLGYRLSIVLDHPGGVTPLVYAPRIALAETDGEDLGYWSTMKADGEKQSELRAVVFQTLFENPQATRPGAKWSAPQRANAQGHSRFVYHLLPEGIEWLPSENQICLARDLPGHRTCEAGEDRDDGCLDPSRDRARPRGEGSAGELTVIWRAFGANDMEAHLDALLADRLRESSAIVHDFEEWRRLFQRLSPGGLDAAGYRLCAPGENSHSFGRICYCR